MEGSKDAEEHFVNLSKIPNSGPYYSAGNFHEKSYPYSALFKSFSPVRAKICENLCNFSRKCGIFPVQLTNFVQNWRSLGISYPTVH